jgi:pilus assembly protein CpaB
MGRRTVLLIVAVLIAAAGTALILMYVQGINARAVEGQERVEVLAATDQIDAGEKFSDAQAAGKIDTVEIARDDMVDGALASADSITDEVAVSTIYPDEQILAQKFGMPEDAQTLPIPDGMMAVSVELTDPARVAGFVEPGSKVAIFTTSGDGQTGTTRLLLSDIEVLAAGQTTSAPAGSESAPTEDLPKALLTLAVDQVEAQKVVYASQNGQLYFALLREDSLVSDTDPGTTSNNLFD